VQRFSEPFCPLFADAPLAVLHFADMVLRDAGQFGELFLGQAFPVAVGPQGHFLFPSDILGKYFRDGVGALFLRFKGFRVSLQLRNLAAANAQGYGYKLVSTVLF
jgi:hypothetical protein